LQSICLQEGIAADRKALSLIANKGSMIPRDCLILLQQVINQCKKVEYDSTAECLELIADKYYFTFYKLLLSDKISVYEYLSLIHEISTKLDMDDFIDGLINFTTRGIYVYNNIPVDGLDVSELPAYSKLFAQFSPSDIVFMLNYLTALRHDKDAEVKLMKLGYTGIQSTTEALNSGLEGLTELASVSELTTSASSDAQAGSSAFQERTTITEADRENIIKAETAPVDLNNILDMFGGVRVNT
jgi:DNA polymerase III gamma/tau subunit